MTIRLIITVYVRAEKADALSDLLVSLTLLPLTLIEGSR